MATRSNVLLLKIYLLCLTLRGLTRSFKETIVSREVMMSRKLALFKYSVKMNASCLNLYHYPSITHVFRLEDFTPLSASVYIL